jgi:hypothetical protein
MERGEGSDGGRTGGDAERRVRGKGERVRTGNGG